MFVSHSLVNLLTYNVALKSTLLDFFALIYYHINLILSEKLDKVSFEQNTYEFDEHQI